MSEEEEHTQTFSGYLAELIKLRAERAGMTPQEYVLSFFERGCNAPSGAVGSLSKETANNHFLHARCIAPCALSRLKRRIII